MLILLSLLTCFNTIALAKAHPNTVTGPTQFPPIPVIKTPLAQTSPILLASETEQKAIQAPKPAPKQGPASRLRQGVKHLQEGHLDKAIADFQEVVETTFSSDEQELKIKALKGLSLIYQQLGQGDRAASYLKQLHQLAVLRGDRNNAAKALATLGNIYQAQGQYIRARGNYAQARDIYLELNDPLNQGRIATSLGNIQLQLGQYASALSLYRQGLKLANEAQDARGSLDALNNIGAVEASDNRNTQARQAYEQALAFAQALSSNTPSQQTLKIQTLQRTQATLHYNLGSLHHAQQNPDAAAAEYQAGLSLIRSNSSESVGRDITLEASLLSGIGLLQEQQKDYQQALKNLRQSANLLQAAAVEATTAGNPSVNTSQARLALVLGNLGYVHWRMGQLAQAEATLQSSIKLRESIRRRSHEPDDDPFSPGQSAQGATAKPDYNRNTDLEQVSLFDTQSHAYALLQQVLVAQGKPEQALAIAERGRNRAFIELLNQRNTNTSALPSSNISLTQIQQLARSTNSTLVEYSVIPDETFIAQGKQQGEAKAIFIWVIQPNGSIHFRNISLASLQQQNLSLRQAVQLARCFDTAMICRRRIARSSPSPRTASSRTESRFSSETAEELSALEQFHQWLIAPIADLLPADPNATVTLIPHDILFLLPFAALRSPDNQLLLQQHTLGMAPSLQSLMLLEQTDSTFHQSNKASGLPASAKPNSLQHLSGQDILLVGNPTMPRVRTTGQLPRQLSPLPGTEIEVQAIAQYLTKATPLLGDKASEAAITPKLPQARWIHLATHGLLEYSGAGPKGTSIPGAIALAPGPNPLKTLPGEPNAQDGLLTANEIIDLDLNAELVVLSACDTGRGEITGDGVIGLSRAWLGAGAENILVSLWAVPDDSTAVLMDAFYQNLSQGQSKAQALRQAMLTTQDFEGDPRHWAAFQLVGRG